MVTKVTASDGDTLCGLAVANGFPNCDRLRVLAENRDFLNRPLRSTDQVTIPDLIPGLDTSVPTTVLTTFLRLGKTAELRFVHGSPTAPAADDPTLTVLNISNFVTTRAGIPETRPFPPDSNSRFDANADADPDAFKLELFDRFASAATVTVEMLALKPTFAADGTVSGHEEFTGADRGARSLTVTLRRLTSDPQRYRSCYLRLVSDQEDKNSRARQTLLVTDTADGSGGDADKLELLEQVVRASFPLPTCNAPGGQRRCQAIAEAPIGEDKLRMRVQVHVLRTTVGGAGLVRGITLQEVRRHMMKWVRRTYAQANVTLRLTGPAIEAVDPLRNLISIFNPGNRTAVGGHAIQVRVNTDPAPTTLSHTTAADETPAATAAALAAQISALPGFSATVGVNPLSFINSQSADIVVTRSDGKEVVLDQAVSNDPRQRIGIGRVNPAFSTTPESNFFDVGARDHRTLIRNFAKDPTSIHVFVINRFRPEDGAVGYAYSRDHHIPATMQTLPPVMGCCFVDAGTMRSNDREVHTADHEIGHILCDMVHFSGRHPELMTGDAVDVVNGVGASKRISDRPLSYSRFNSATRRSVAESLNPVLETRTREAAAFLESFTRP